tara:strand:+ start:10769 stop:12097 length:1329 start_codon:yes stop_codon:yes gene_type:complete
MIVSMSDILQKQSQWDAQQKQKNIFRANRRTALDYYNGRTQPYTEKLFSEKLRESIPIANVNITKRIVDRISMVYMVEPLREYTREDVPDLFYQKNHKLQRLERYTNLLDAVLIKPCWRNDNIEYDIIHDYEPHFGSDPMKPIAFTYPLQIKSEVLDDTPTLYEYWDAETHLIYDEDGKIQPNPDNPENLNWYGVLPFVECWRDGKPEYAYFDTDPLTDLIQTNYLINVSETNKMANVHYQSFGYLYANGSQVDKDDLEVGQDKIMYLGMDGNLNVVSPPNSIPALSEAIKDSYKMLTQNYHLPTSFAEGTTAESGVALRLRNQELQDERKSDIVRWRNVEMELFELEKIIVLQETGSDAGELLSIDFSESTDILSAQEQRDKWEWELSKGLIDEADILMQMNPDGYETRQEALEFLSERGVKKPEEQVEQSPLLQALTKPV